MNEKLVRLSDVEFYLRQTAKNMIDAADMDAETLTDEEVTRVSVCACALRALADNAHLIPTADAVEVVRCRDCKHRGSPYSCPMRKLVMPFSGPGAFEDCTTDESFCSFGVRKEAE